MQMAGGMLVHTVDANQEVRTIAVCINPTLESHHLQFDSPVALQYIGCGNL